MEEWLIWVNELDQEIGYGEKMKTHREERLHRAFSIFLYDPQTRKLLLHQRAAGKYHSGGLWTNACCSHPRRGEEIRDAAVRRLKEELGITLDTNAALQELGSFQYYQKYTNCAEHEIDHVFFLSVNAQRLSLYPDPEEIAQLRWVTFSELKHWMSECPQDFTAWFAKALELVLREKKGIEIL
ncbi:isopentenyl-diphosphate Delta-isomerase [uncultured Faecalibaculum sp.]|uniref:isopentenyl-diphosphate Delta-isomerase n=1 Tax=uncultured Faecalibaculum sp. TaxID=1729681 RepID=UPI002711DB8E|nr:isopentenyl-diphosphate Delta-isomerase [uncultured Faecalibaculum sp.]